MKKRILLVAGTRPNFIKLAPLFHRLKNAPDFETFICHTGQHFDFNMSDIFWESLELPQPDFQLNIKGSGVVDAIGKTILGINEVIRQQVFELVVVFGDVNATAAGAIAAVQSRIPLMHVEAGLRSYDRDMPEEINRVITDHIADYLMISEPSGLTNLGKEGVAIEKCCLVGNIMIESLLRTQLKWRALELQQPLKDFAAGQPLLMTFHRPENVDRKESLDRVVGIIRALAERDPVIFPLHPRTLAKLREFRLWDTLEKNPRIMLTEPLGYFQFLQIMSKSGLVVTDSGGVQEETSFLNIPCVTFRKNTERPITQILGTNTLMDIRDDDFLEKIRDHKENLSRRPPQSIPLWDGEVSGRILHFMKEHL
jgi:UDP-N-acetylglucosamine 2-epimerase (non-hydrolysing)